MSSHIIKTKLLIPTVYANLVPRLRLIEQIEDGLQAGHRLTLVSAPAGSGKTTAASAWAHHNQRRVAWLSLEESDNETGLFWTYLLASIQAVLPDFAQSLFAALTATPPTPIAELLPALVNELSALDQSLVLVLDDYHVIANHEIHDSISFLLDHQPRNFHLVIATRADPPLPIARLRAQRLLTELRAEDLRFTGDESQALLNDMMALGLSPEDVTLLETRTEGWGVGLLLAAQSMQGRTDKSEFISSFSGSQHYILEYLIEEVLNRQTVEAREFLLKTSILDRFCGPLCDAVLDGNNSTEAIQELSKDNLFIIPLDQDHSWYRYHHLFADLLANFLHKEFPQEDILQLHRRASQWYQAENDSEKAIHYVLSGQDFVLAADLIERILDRVIARGHVRTALKWIEAIPQEIIESRPRLLVHQGWTTFLSGESIPGLQILQRAKDTLPAIPDEGERNLLNGRVSAMLATGIALTPDIDGAIAQAHEALSFLPDYEFTHRARAVRVLGVCHMFQGKLEQALETLQQAEALALEGQNKFMAAEMLSQIANIRRHQGKLSLARQAYRQILELYDQPEISPPACLGYIGLAGTAFEQNDLQNAEDYLNKGIELSQKGSIGYALPQAHLVGGLLKCAQGDLVGAQEAIHMSEALTRTDLGALEGTLELTSIQIRLSSSCGEFELGRDSSDGRLLPAGPLFEAMPVLFDEMHHSLLARVHLMHGEFSQVLDICESVGPQAGAGGRLARVIDLNLFKAVALWELERPDEAIAALEKCLTLAEPEGYVRLFLEVGDGVLDMLRRVKTTGKWDAYVQRLEAAFQGTDVAEPIQPQTGLPDPLTNREMEVLKLMCEGLSNQAIADQMVVSINTVKKHTSNIYGKLGVRNRAQAVLRARDINLV